MNTNIRSTLSASTALGLVSFTLTSALVASLAAPATVLGFGLLAVYGVVEIGAVAYEQPRSVAARPSVSMRLPRSAAGTDTLIAFPAVTGSTLVRAA